MSTKITNPAKSMVLNILSLSASQSSKPEMLEYGGAPFFICRVFYQFVFSLFFSYWLFFWWGTLGKLQLMLRKAAKALYQVKIESLTQIHKYRNTQKPPKISCCSERQVHRGGDAQLQDGGDGKRGDHRSTIEPTINQQSSQ